MLTVSCPICAKQVAWNSEHPFKPFCSAQCRQQDLGAWATESYKIPDPDHTQDEGVEE